MEKFADDIRDDLIKLEDAAKVEIGGLQEERIFIEFDNTNLPNINLLLLDYKELSPLPIY